MKRPEWKIFAEDVDKSWLDEVGVLSLELHDWALAENATRPDVHGELERRRFSFQKFGELDVWFASDVENVWDRRSRMHTRPASTV